MHHVHVDGIKLRIKKKLNVGKLNLAICRHNSIQILNNFEFLQIKDTSFLNLFKCVGV